MHSYLIDPAFTAIKTWSLLVLTWSSRFVNTLVKISAYADGGPRSRVCARETLRSTPIDVSGNFPAPCLQSGLQPSPPAPQKLNLKFWYCHSGMYLKLAHFPVKIGLIFIFFGGGSPPKKFSCHPNIFVTWEPIQNFRNLWYALLGYIWDWSERRCADVVWQP